MAKQTQKYNVNYLSKVIARADFTSVLPVHENGNARHVLKEVAHTYPVFETVEEETAKMVVQGTKQPTVEHSTSTQLWYWTPARDRRIILSPDFISVEHRRYTTYEDLRGEFLPLVSAGLQLSPGNTVKRLGLRYINKLNPPGHDPTDWQEYLNKKLLGIFEIASDRGTIARAMHLLEFNYGQFQFRFQYGIHNADYPAPVRRREFILDFDAFIRTQLEASEIGQHVDQFHEKVNSAFEEVIEDGLRRSMDVRRTN